MPRLLVLLPLVVWLLRPGEVGTATAHQALAALGVVLLGCLAWPVLAAVAAVVADRRLRAGRAPPRVADVVVRSAVPGIVAWHAAGVFGFAGVDWAAGVATLAGAGDATPVLVLATLPAYAAWALVPACEWPAERRRADVRRRRDDALSAWHGRDDHPPPDAGGYFDGFATFWTTAVRTRLLLTLAPLAVFWLCRDAASALAAGAGLAGDAAAIAATGLGLAAAVVVAPPIVVRILPTRPFDADDEARLDALCSRAGVPPRALRVWDTDHRTANALAVGFVPGLRYVLVSDVLVDALTPWQLEAVAAHELGHVRRRHALWLVVYVLAAGTAAAGPVAWGYDAAVSRWLAWLPMWADTAAGIIVLVLMAWGFVLVSRRCEREADVEAARLVEPLPGRLVGHTGAWAFSQALRAAVTLSGGRFEPGGRRGVRAWLADALHGPPASRAALLSAFASGEASVRAFDRRGLALRVLAVTCIVAGGVWLLA